MPTAPPRGHCISIHTLHTEGDINSGSAYARRGISIHTLHTEGDEVI